MAVTIVPIFTQMVTPVFINFFSPNCCLVSRRWYICTPILTGPRQRSLKYWAISSAGSEHLVYTEGVGSSNLSLPTTFKPVFTW